MVKELFMLIKERLLLKETLVLVTVTESAGSTPRGVGACMLVGKGPVRLWGSIGGGLPEHYAVLEAGRILGDTLLGDTLLGDTLPDDTLPEDTLPGSGAGERDLGISHRKYSLHPGVAADLGLRCGGEIFVFFRRLCAEDPGLLSLAEKGLACFEEKKAAWFIMEVGSGAGAKHAEGFSFGVVRGKDAQFFTQDAPQNLASFLSPLSVCRNEEGKSWLSVPLLQEGFVYVFGGGHVAQELVPLLSHLGFRCAIFDDREEFAQRDLFPTAEKIMLGDFEHIGEQITLSAKDYAVIITRGHLWDLEAWAFALDSPAAYIGVIGSKSKHEFVRRQLKERGFTEEAICAPRVHAPIGLEIKSDTPAEIAVSIAGELILCRALNVSSSSES